MGISIRLNILPEAIRPEAWAVVYDETLAFLTGCPQGILGLREETVGRVRRLSYKRALERRTDDPGERHWKANGDAETKACAESFILYRDLARYRPPLSRDPLAPGFAADYRDILAPGQLARSRTVFNDKTQGSGYHIPMLAVAMLVETAFPEHAVADGDIDAGQAEQAQRLIRAVLGRSVPRPVVTDGPRLLTRLQETRLDGAALDSFSDAFRGAEDAAFTTMAATVGEALFAQWFGRVLKRSFGRSTPMDATHLLTAWFNADLPASLLIETCCVSPSGPRFQAAALAEALAATWVTVPPEDRALVLEAFWDEPALARNRDSVSGETDPVMMATEGRRTRRYVSEAALTDAFRDVYPGRVADTIGEILARRTQKEKAAVDKLTDAVRRFGRPALIGGKPPGRRHSFRDLTLVESLDDLSAEERALLADFCDTLRTGRQAVLEALAHADETNRLTLPEAVAQLSHKHGIPLTEDAWARLDRPEHRGELEVAFVFMSMRGTEKTLRELRRAVLENPVLCRFLAGCSEDDEDA